MDALIHKKMVFWFVKVKKVIQFPHVPSSKVRRKDEMACIRQWLHNHSTKRNITKYKVFCYYFLVLFCRSSLEGRKNISIES